MQPRKNRILISEDMDLWQGIFSRLLADSGYEVRAAKDLAHTQELLDRCLFVVAIVDICLDSRDESNRDGVTTMKKIKALNEGTKAIVLTGHGTVELAVQAMREFEVFHFLEKEKFNKEDFLKLIAEACTKASYDLRSIGLTGDALRWFEGVDMHAASSMLQVRLEVLEGMLRGLMGNLVPVVACRGAVLSKASPDGPALTFECWSKAAAVAVKVEVVLDSAVAAARAETALATNKNGKTLGYILPTEEPFESFVTK